jgi:hypothetical protein
VFSAAGAELDDLTIDAAFDAERVRSVAVKEFGYPPDCTVRLNTSRQGLEALAKREGLADTGTGP